MTHNHPQPTPKGTRRMTDKQDPTMTKTEREQLIRVTSLRAKQAEREAEMRQKILLAELQNELTAEFKAHDQLWKEAVIIAEEVVAKANAEIVARCADLGVPAEDAPGLELGWRARSSRFATREQRAELRKLAETRLTALTKTAKTEIQRAALETEEQLVFGGLQSDEARELFASMPTVEQIMPALSLDDLGVKHWQPPEDAVTQLTAPLTTTRRKRRQILRAIEANPAASDRAIAAIANCDHKTVGAYRRDRRELPAITGGFPTPTGESPTPDEPPCSTSPSARNPPHDVPRVGAHPTQPPPPERNTAMTATDRVEEFRAKFDALTSRYRLCPCTTTDTAQPPPR
jgi:hypothetical protein